MANHIPCIIASMPITYYDWSYLGGGRGFGEAAVLLYTTGSGSDLRWNNFSFTSPTSPINVLRPLETLSIQIWNLQTNGQDRALANLSSLCVDDFSIGI